MVTFPNIKVIQLSSSVFKELLSRFVDTNNSQIIVVTYQLDKEKGYNKVTFLSVKYINRYRINAFVSKMTIDR